MIYNFCHSVSLSGTDAMMGQWGHGQDATPGRWVHVYTAVQLMLIMKEIVLDVLVLHRPDT